MVRLALVLALSATSCASIIHGPNETITVESSPQGADVRLRCGTVMRTGITPTTITIPRRADGCTITVSKSGRKEQSVTLERTFAKPYWLNFIGIGVLPFGISDASPLSISGDAGLALILAGGLGLAVDRIDGAMYRHEPKSISVTLEPD